MGLDKTMETLMMVALMAPFVALAILVRVGIDLWRRK